MQDSYATSAPQPKIQETKGAHYCTIDLKDFYLNTPMERPEYMRLMEDRPRVLVRQRKHGINSLTAIGFRESQLIYELRWCVVLP
jgi:hypothetical protein